MDLLIAGMLIHYWKDTDSLVGGHLLIDCKDTTSSTVDEKDAYFLTEKILRCWQKGQWLVVCIII